MKQLGVGEFHLAFTIRRENFTWTVLPLPPPLPLISDVLLRKRTLIQCNAMQCNAMQCNAMQCNTIQCNAIQYRTYPFKC